MKADSFLYKRGTRLEQVEARLRLLQDVHTIDLLPPLLHRSIAGDSASCKKRVSCMHAGKGQGTSCREKENLTAVARIALCATASLCW